MKTRSLLCALVLVAALLVIEVTCLAMVKLGERGRS